MAAQTNVVILGASFTGTGVAHSVLKNVPNAKVTLINPSDLFYFALAAPRVLAKPAEVPLDKVLISIPNAFKQYPEAKFQFVRGSVTSVDVAAKTVSLQDQTTIKYDYLVIATGATTPSTISEQITPFKPTPGGDLKQSIQDAQQRISNATSIIIGGAGPIGVETAGEISQAYKAKSVTLISSHDQLLPGLKPSVAAAAASNLKRHGVEIILSAKITDSQLQADGKWKVMLSNGKTLDTDLYISAMGSIPNTSFLDPVYLDDSKGIKVDSNLRMSGVEDGSVFALGDATFFKHRFLMRALDQIPVVAGNLKAAILGAGKTTTYATHDKIMVFVPTGSDSGTGQVGSFGVFSFLVAMIKGKDFFVSKAASYIMSK